MIILMILFLLPKISLMLKKSLRMMIQNLIHLIHKMEKWTTNHPKEQILGNPNSSVITRAQVRARNEVLNVNQEFCMFHVFYTEN